jgi:hypothetical protein
MVGYRSSVSPGSNVHERKIIGESIPKYGNTENKPFQIKKLG